MSVDNKALRDISFASEYHFWLIVRHFLSPELSRDLFRSIVKRVSENAFDIEDVVEEISSGGAGLLSSWTIRPRHQETALGRYFVRLLQSWIWQGDGEPGLSNLELDSRNSRAVGELDCAFRLSAVDFSNFDSFTESNSDHMSPISAFVEAARSVKSIITGNREGNLGDVAAAIRHQVKDDFLGNLLMKHLGDLCGDADCWSEALEIYVLVDKGLRKCRKGSWAYWVPSLIAINQQSMLGAKGMAVGHNNILSSWEKFASGASPTSKAWPVIALNATPELMHAQQFAQEFGHQDRRGASLQAPQIIDIHDLTSALSHSQSGKYRDAYRFFWAVLRRQIALGSFVYSRNTKAHYGKALLDDLNSQLDSNRYPDVFALGVQQLVESLDRDMVDRIDWNERLVLSYVNVDAIENAVAVSTKSFGVKKQRERVVVGIFTKWLKLVAADADIVATKMITYLAQRAIDNGREFFTPKNVGGEALKALQEVGESRPEFKALDLSLVSQAIFSHLRSRNELAIEDAIDTAFIFVDKLDNFALSEIVTEVLDQTTKFNLENTGWRVARVAIRFLSSDHVIDLARRQSDLGGRVVSELIRLSLGNADQAAILYLTRNLPADLIEGKVEEREIEKVVLDLRKQALQVNSSSASSSIHALLISPARTKVEGYRDAILGLQKTLASVSSSLPSFSFADSYRSLLFLANYRGEISVGLGLSIAEVDRMLEPLFDPLFAMWKLAPVRPQIFNGFSLPPKTVPNPTIVHNWTFASDAFANALGRSEDLVHAMAYASQNEFLAKPIAVARAIRRETHDHSLLDVEQIKSDKSEAFYAVLGLRLLGLKDVSANEKADVVQVLFEQCMRFGPDGLDAGLFVFADQLGIALDAKSSVAQAYYKRLLANRQLRLGLTPLFERASLSAD